MKARSRAKHKGRRESGTFTLIPHAVQDSPNWHNCGGTAIKLVCDLARNYNGRNNGDLCASFSLLNMRGWRSKDTLDRALREAVHYGFIVLTRQGGLHQPSLYAITWQSIDDCNGKLECAATIVAPGNWKIPRERFERPRRNRKPGTETVSHRYGMSTATHAQAA